MTGTLINASGILLGSLAALLLRRDLGHAFEQRIRYLVAIAAMSIGCWLLWKSTHGGLWDHLRQFLVIMAGLLAGNAIGLALGLQKSLSRVATHASDALRKPELANGFKVSAALFCLTPLAVLGAVMEGLSGDAWVLALKASMDTVAAYSLARSFGKGVCLSWIPVLAFQGNLSLLCRWLQDHYLNPNVIDGVMAVSGMMVFVSIVLILGVGKPRLGDYLPALGVTGVLAYWLW